MLVLERNAQPWRVVLGFDCGSSRAYARLLAYDWADGKLAFDAPSTTASVSFARRLTALSDLDGDGVQDFAVQSLEAPAQAPVITLHSGMDGRQLQHLEPEADEKDSGACVLSGADHDGDGVREVLLACTVADPAQRSRYAALVVHSGKTGARLARIVSNEKAGALQGSGVWLASTQPTAGRGHAYLLAGRAVLDFDLDAAVQARAFHALAEDPTPQRLLQDGAQLLLLEAPLGAGDPSVRTMRVDSLEAGPRQVLAGLRQAVELCRVPDRNQDGVADWFALQSNSASGLGQFLSGKDWSTLGMLQPDGAPMPFLAREALWVSGRGLLISNTSPRPRDGLRGAYWINAAGQLGRVFTAPD